MARITIVAPHKTDAAHLAKVTAEMATLGAPRIRVVQSGTVFWAIEGVHRLAAAAALGLAPEIEIVDETSPLPVVTQWDGEDRAFSSVDEIRETFAGDTYAHGAIYDEVEV